MGFFDFFGYCEERFCAYSLHRSLCVHLPLFLLGWELRRRVARSYDNLCFTFWGTGQLLSAVHYCQRCLSVSASSTLTIPCYFQSVDYIPVSIKWHILVVLICVSLMINTLEKFFIYLLDIFRSSLEECLFNYFAHFFPVNFIFLIYSIRYITYKYFLPLCEIFWSRYLKILMNLFWQSTIYQFFKF